MFHFYNILFLSVFFTCSITSDIEKRYANRTITSSRSIYDLVQVRRAAARLAAYYNKTHRNKNIHDFNQLDNKFFNINNDNIYASRSEIIDPKTNQNRFLIKRLILIIIINGIVLGFMIIVVILCVVARYFRDKNQKPIERVEQRKPLNPSRRRNRTTRYSEASYDTRNFSRKPRTLPTAV